MIQNIMAVRFGNSLFEPLWNHNYIDNVQITSFETIGIENRGGYYEGAGILKDMLQNHLLQLLSIIAMEPPVNLEPERIRDEKVKVLRALRLFDEKSALQDIILGQYGAGNINNNDVVSYRQEERVSPESNTATFVAVKAYIDNFRWGGVPFYIRSGKRMKNKATEIVIQFKKLPGVNFYKDYSDNESNLLVIKIQPREGFFFQVNAKRPGSEFMLEQVQMDYCQSCRIENNSPEAYERIILEAIKNNTSLFTRWDELECCWSFIESIEGNYPRWETNFPNYSAGTDGPRAAQDLIIGDGRRWWDIEI
jgi:glucose-6-phosphate 1-dehydrogenase